jgi:hypothetical protein
VLRSRRRTGVGRTHTDVSGRSLSTDEQAILDAYERWRQARREHLRRTRMVGGRLFLGRGASLLIGLTVLVAPLALLFGRLHLIELEIDWATVGGVALTTAALATLSLVGQREQRERTATGNERAARRATLRRSTREALRMFWTGIALAVFGTVMVLERDATVLLGAILAFFGASALFFALTSLLANALRRLFGRRPAPPELVPIPSGAD